MFTISLFLAVSTIASVNGACLNLQLKDVPGCKWQPIQDPNNPSCTVNYMCTPEEPGAREGKGIGDCPAINQPPKNGVYSSCNWVPTAAPNGCLNGFNCPVVNSKTTSRWTANYFALFTFVIPEIQQSFRYPYFHYYVGPYRRDKSLYPEYPPGWLGGAAFTVYPDLMKSELDRLEGRGGTQPPIYTQPPPPLTQAPQTQTVPPIVYTTTQRPTTPFATTPIAPWEMTTEFGTHEEFTAGPGGKECTAEILEANIRSFNSGSDLRQCPADDDVFASDFFCGYSEPADLTVNSACELYEICAATGTHVPTNIQPTEDDLFENLIFALDELGAPEFLIDAARSGSGWVWRYNGAPVELNIVEIDPTDDCVLAVANEEDLLLHFETVPCADFDFPIVCVSRLVQAKRKVRRLTAARRMKIRLQKQRQQRIPGTRRLAHRNLSRHAIPRRKSYRVTLFGKKKRPAKANKKLSNRNKIRRSQNGRKGNRRKYQGKQKKTARKSGRRGGKSGNVRRLQNRRYGRSGNLRRSQSRRRKG